MIGHISLRLSLVEISGDQVVVRVESSNYGPSAWPAHQFLLPTIARKSNKWFNSFVTHWTDISIAQYVENDPAFVDFGKKLFALIFQGKALEKFNECKNAAKTAQLRLRVLIDCFGSRLDCIPFELMHDGHSFLVHDSTSIIRAVSTIPGPRASGGIIRSLLVVLADPKFTAKKITWGEAAYAQTLKTQLTKIGGRPPKMLSSCSWADFESALSVRTASYDAIYIVAHGEPPTIGGGEGRLVFEKAGQKPEPIAAHQVAAVLGRHPGCFVYLNSCSTAVAPAENPFAGIAQTLLTIGGCGAVLAMQRPILASDAQAMATSFFRDLAQGESVEAAHQRAVSTAPRFSWAIPRLYTQKTTAGQDLKDRLRAFFSVTDPKNTMYEFRLPRFRLGLPEAEYEKRAGRRTLKNPDSYNYKGPTYACDDLTAAMTLMHMVSDIVPMGRSAELMGIKPASMDQIPTGTHVFFFGSKSHQTVGEVLEQFSKLFKFKYNSTHWSIEDVRRKIYYRVKSPARFTPGTDERQLAEETDYAIVAKFVSKASKRVYFVVGGMQAIGTRGAAEYLQKNWQNLVIKYGDQPFQVLLKFAPGLREPEVVKMGTASF